MPHGTPDAKIVGSDGTIVRIFPHRFRQKTDEQRVRELGSSHKCLFPHLVRLSGTELCKDNNNNNNNNINKYKYGLPYTNETAVVFRPFAE